MAEDKEYVGTMKLGDITDSQDADGEIVETQPGARLSREQIEAAFAKFHGDFYQMPPMVSAIKKDGVPLYKLARQGKTVEREPRFVHVYAHEIQAVRLPEIDFRVVCSQGFLRPHLRLRHRQRTRLRRAPASRCAAPRAASSRVEHAVTVEEHPERSTRDDDRADAS